MADKKISQLTAATTPLVGTEVLPVVQSGSTVKVSVANLTAGRTVGATSVLLDAGGVLYGANTSGSFYSAITPYDGSGNMTFLTGYAGGTMTFTTGGSLRWTLDNTGNLIQGTAAKGINFTANTGAANMTSQLLNWYEEGTWTPTLGGSTADPTGVTYVSQVGRYTRVGRTVTVSGQLAFTTYTGGTGNLFIRGLPFAVNGTQSGIGNVNLEQVTFSAGYTSMSARAFVGLSVIDILQSGSAVNWLAMPIGNAASSATGKYIAFTVTYEV